VREQRLGRREAKASFETKQNLLLPKSATANLALVLVSAVNEVGVCKKQSSVSPPRSGLSLAGE
jgi:hypothetical protein